MLGTGTLFRRAAIAYLFTAAAAHTAAIHRTIIATPRAFIFAFRTFIAATGAAQIFVAGGNSPAYMPFRKVFIKHFAHTRVQLFIHLVKPFGYVFMHGRLAYAEMVGALPYRCAGLKYVFGTLPCAPRHIFPHKMFPHSE